MSFQQSQRDPQPQVGNGGMIAALALFGVGFGLAGAALVGMGASAAVAGRGWVWPPHGGFYHCIGALLHGRPAAGLPPAMAIRLPSVTVVYIGVACAELLLLVAAITGLVVYATCRRPSDARGGMATRGEAARALGVGQLRSVQGQIRPDLVPPRGRASR